MTEESCMSIQSSFPTQRAEVNHWKGRAQLAEQECARLRTLAEGRQAELKILARKVARFQGVVDAANAALNG